MAEFSATTNAVKKNMKSVVWLYFELEANERGVQIPREDNRLVCRTCKKAVQCKGGNTMNLFIHFQDTHPELYKEVMQSKACSNSHLLLSSKRECSMILKVFKQRS